jgi:ribosomal-protein-alanine N-acetyltransferase
LRCYVRLMRKGDVDQVTGIDHEAFPTIWPPINYKREIQNRLAHYIVACDEEMTVDDTGVRAASGGDSAGLVAGVRRLLERSRLFSDKAYSSTREYIIGFTGFWVMADEAHIISIAVREPQRRQGVGELLLISTIDMAPELNARSITLEVRASNIAAQSLYCKYGFAQVGVRKGYYIDNREDAILMTTEDVTSDLFQSRFEQLKQAYWERKGIPLPRLVR